MVDVVGEAGLRLIAHEFVSVPFEVLDQARLELAMGFVARGSDVEESKALQAIVAAATPFRRPDGSYRFENEFRFVVSSTPSRSPTPGPS